MKKAIDAGAAIGPKIHVTGPYFEGPGSFTPQMHELKDAEDARRTAEYWVAEGVTSFKAYMHITPDELSAIVKVAHAHGLKVTGHLCSIGFREAASIGIDDLEHGIFADSEFVEGRKPDTCPEGRDTVEESLLNLDATSGPLHDTIRDLIGKHVAVTSTLPVFETIVPNRAPLEPRVLDAMLPEARIQYLQRRSIISDGAAKSHWPALLKKEMEFEREFAKEGGLLLAGLDPTGYGGVIAGFGDQREVELLVEAGFTPLEAIHIATANGAEFLGEQNQIGTIAPGKAADIVVINGDPSANIKDIENVEIVFKDGVGYDSAKIDRVGERIGRPALSRAARNVETASPSTDASRQHILSVRRRQLQSNLMRQRRRNVPHIDHAQILPAGTPGPIRKNEARKSGTSGNSPCVPPIFVFVSSGVSASPPVRHPGFILTKNDAVGYPPRSCNSIRIQNAIDAVRRIGSNLCQQFLHLRTHGRIVSDPLTRSPPTRPSPTASPASR